MTTVLTAAQRDITASEARVTVVAAGPGSGKTRVFVTMLRDELAAWGGTRAGIAALSFTNVAQELIANRLGGRPIPPHFVGTLDSFIWRFIVRPFGHLAGLRRGGARLIPGPVQDALHSERDEVQVGERSDRQNIFRIWFWGGTEDRPQFAYKRKYEDAPTLVPEGLAASVIERKRREWARTGRVSHSDCQFLASHIVRGKQGRVVANLLANRFPLLLVDEAQDTGWFLARCLYALIAQSDIRAVVTGDPDQGIYGFGGMKPPLFERLRALPGARSFFLNESHRCPAKIAVVASALSRSRAAITPVVAHPGIALLVVHRDSRPRLSTPLADLVARTAAREKCSSVAFLARKTAVVLALAGGAVKYDAQVTSRAAKNLYRAAKQLYAGDSAGAARITSTTLSSLLLGDEHVTEALLARNAISLRAWRNAVGRVLLASAATPEGDTWKTWISRVRSSVEDQGIRLVGSAPSDLGRRMACGKHADEKKGVESAARDPRGWKHMTVHKAKGLEFDLVTFYSPHPDRYTRCPSEEWWSGESANEEREVAYVAATRAARCLILCVHEVTAHALAAKHPEFVRSFDVVTLPEV